METKEYEDEDIDEEAVREHFARTASDDELSNQLNSLIIRVKPSSTFRRFVLSVAQQYMNTGSLSDAQHRVIDAAYARQNRERG